ncbi:glycine betaine ABC transporter substrate-binding protein [Clostridium massiliodielmoense]|uniref:glycine betaine ABC transporter substrate-binding protein n=1 Tax=Clostridium massiliodielmoense TaxID=1776385 RepID=UPI0004D6448E|nr:glycine betaine ABC transporter substrate-binding protein [Clostridium massiliodielmoense]KEH99121.1 glycine/betaine ABC transporter [Clostridium botulinum C/D str. BKT12695]
MEGFIIFKEKLNKGLSLFLIVSIIICLSGCGLLESQIPKTNDRSKGKVKIGYVQWASAEASTYIVKEVLEQMGYYVELYILQTGILYQATSQGNIDAFVCSWLPDTDTNYWKKHKDKLVELNDNYTSAQIGIVVPNYVTIDNIADMKKYKDKFKNRIVGIDPGAAQMKVTQDDVMPHYGLNKWILEESSGSAMTAELKRAIDKKEWIAVTGWKPHWMWSKWDLKFLKDPDLVMGKGECIKTMGRPNIKEEMPEVASFFQKYRLNTEDFSSVMLEIQDGESPSLVAKRFVKTHPELVKTWTEKVSK